MLKRVILSLIMMTCLSGMLAAQEPGVFLPFYTVYDDVVVHEGGGTADGHQVVFFKDNPMASESVIIAGSAFEMNIMRPRYFAQFNVNPGTTCKIGVVQGADGYGMDPVDYVPSGAGFDKVEIVLREGEGGGLVNPDGTVPLDIDNSGGDVLVSWDSNTYPAVDIYRLDGDGTGQFSNKYPGTDTGSANGWQLVSAADSDGEYRNNYIASGPMEAYYKALIAGEDAAAKLPAAWAVGKFDLSLVPGFNLSSTPLVPLHGNSIDDVFVGPSGGALRSDGIEVYFFDESSRLSIKALFDNNEWKYFPNTPFTVTLGSGYWIKQDRRSLRLSMLGAVINEANIRTLGTGFSLISSPVPVYYGSLADAGLPARGTDEIYFFDANTGLQSKLINKNGEWSNAVPGEKPFGLIPGRGYWYKNNGVEFDWTLSP